MNVKRERRKSDTYGVDALQPRIAQDVKGEFPSGLNPPIGHAVAGVGEAQILLLHGELVLADGEAHDGELVDGGVGWEDVPLLCGVVFAAGDGLVDGRAEIVVDEREGRSGVRNGLVAGSGDGFAGYDCGGAVEHPEALGVVHGCVFRGFALEGFFVNVAEGVEGFAFVGVIGIFDGAKLDREELG